ncbi:MAG: thioredoxin family protein [Actinomycetota bacterium]|nr:thioredoxin family protein [Actinomycetota bacterium]
MPEAAEFQPITSGAELEQVLTAPGEAPVLLFLHDPFCPISAEAYEEVNAVSYRVMLVDVSAGNQLSREVERRTGVRHESPQLLLLQGGVACWSASHYAITASAARNALREHSGKRS